MAANTAAELLTGDDYLDEDESFESALLPGQGL